MTTFAARPNKDIKKASGYFSKMYSDLDLEKYKLAKYQDLFQLSSFQAMHDADLAYHSVYCKCAKNAETKESLLNCLEQEEKFSIKHHDAFNDDNYRHHTIKAIHDIKQQLSNGTLDYLFV